MKNFLNDYSENFLLMDYDLPQLDQEHLTPLYSSQEVSNQDLIPINNYVLDSLDDINTNYFLYSNDNSINSEFEIDFISYSKTPKLNTYNNYEQNLNYNYYDNTYFNYQNNHVIEKQHFFSSDNESSEFLNNSNSSSTSYNSSLEFNFKENNSSFVNNEEKNFSFEKTEFKSNLKEKKKKVIKIKCEEKERIKLEKKRKRLERKKIQNREAAKRYREKKKFEHEKINLDLKNINVAYLKMKSELRDILTEKNIYLKLIKNLNKLSDQNKLTLPKWMT